MTPPRTQRQSHETPFSVLVEVEFRLHLNLRKTLLAVVGHSCRAKLAQFCQAPKLFGLSAHDATITGGGRWFPEIFLGVSSAVSALGRAAFPREAIHGRMAKEFVVSAG